MAALLQDATGDLSLASHGLQIVRDVGQETAQKLRGMLRFIRGEWFLDTRLGIPYFEVIWVKNPDLPAISQMFRRAILQAPGVISTEVTTMELLPTRELDFEFEAGLDGGIKIVGGSSKPFIVESN